MAELVNLGRLPEKVRGVVSPYVGEMIKLHGENVRAVMVYGSATGRNFIPRKSDINLLIVLQKVRLEDLKKSLKLVARGLRKRITAPLFLSEEHMATSSDVFPMEFLEMKENHILLYGEDVLENVKIGRSNLRFLCEQQLKGKLIRLRQAYLEIGLKRRGIEQLLTQSLAALLPTFRNLIRLKGETPPVGKEEVLQDLGRLFEIDAEIFLAVLRDRQGDEKIGRVDAETFLGRYLKVIQKLARAADQLT